MNEEIKEVEKAYKELGDKLAMLKSKKSKVWKPEEDEIYWYIASDGDIRCDSYTERCKSDFVRYSLGNCYKIKADAEFALEKQKLLVAMQRYADEHNEEEIDWKNDKPKFYIYYNYKEKIIQNSTLFAKYIGQIYFTSKEIAENCVKELGEDKIKKYLFGVE
jgi:hypothetical protein